ncbi:MAG TPA: HAMP domain-containing sensor histidine kinase [Patescibacteria group bacterium]|nr:HAMP domain-containing sensor histidine kinase [Patescibacteria group bacterium]
MPKLAVNMYRLILVSAGLLIAIAVLASIFIYYQLYDTQREDLLARVKTFQATLSPDELILLDGADTDLGNRAYIELKDKLFKLKAYNPDVRFFYVMRIVGNSVIFLADSEPPDSRDYSPPGQVYTEASPSIVSLFQTGGSKVEVGQDRWGKWFSGYSAVLDNDGSVVAVAGIDISANHHMFIRLAFASIPLLVVLLINMLLYFLLRMSKKNEEYINLKSEYISIAAHDLRTPLTGIKWLAQSLQNESKATLELYIKGMQDISKTADHVLGSVNDLLNASALEKGKVRALMPQPVKVDEVLKLSYTPLESAAKEKGLTVTFEFSQNADFTISVDPDKMRRVFTNVISNAIKYAKDHGQVKIGGEVKSNTVKLWVQDNGIGIPPEDTTKVFSGYYRSENAKQRTTDGTGLGLYYAKSVVESHGGEIFLESKLGEGTTVFIVLKRH